MAYAWAFDAANDRFTLTLDGTGSGPVSRSKTFTGLEADQLYTFYLIVNPDVVAVGAFFEVEGGDTAVATVTGEQTLRARGTTDGSGNITLRFGAQSIESAPPSSEYSENIEYASIGAFTGTGWAHTSTGGVGHTEAIDTTIVDDGTYSLRMTMNSPGFVSGSSWYTKTVTGLTPLTSYTGQIRVRAQNRPWYVNVIFTLNGGSGPTWTGSQLLDDNWQTATVHGTSDASGEMEVKLGLSGASMGTEVWTAWYDGELTLTGGAGGGTAEITFELAQDCVGSGLTETGGTGAGPGDGEGGPGEDPIPDPPPGGVGTPGVRPFGAFSIPAGGLDHWNATVKQIKAEWAVNLISTATTAGAYLFFVFGQTADWLDGSGVFSYARWKATVDAVYNNATANAALEAAITSGVAFAHYLIDEPNWYKRWGGEIPIATVEKMALYSKSLWPTWPTTIRVGATERGAGGYYITRKLNGLDWLWAQYWTRFGDVTAYRDLEVSRCATFGYDLVIGLNIADFLGAPSRPITPAELDHYGSILADADPDRVRAFMDWQFESGLYAQSGFATTNGRLRDRFKANDP